MTDSKSRVNVYLCLGHVPSLVKTTGLPWLFPIGSSEGEESSPGQHAGRNAEGSDVLIGVERK